MKLVHSEFSDSINLSIDVINYNYFTTLACTKFSKKMNKLKSLNLVYP